MNGELDSIGAQWLAERSINCHLRSCNLSEQLETIYDIGTGTKATIRQTAAMTRIQFGITTEPVRDSIAQRTWDTKDWVANHTKFNRESGSQPYYSLREDLARGTERFAQQKTNLPGPHL